MISAKAAVRPSRDKPGCSALPLGRGNRGARRVRRSRRRDGLAPPDAHDSPLSLLRSLSFDRSIFFSFSISFSASASASASVSISISISISISFSFLFPLSFLCLGFLLSFSLPLSSRSLVMIFPLSSHSLVMLFPPSLRRPTRRRADRAAILYYDIIVALFELVKTNNSKNMNYLMRSMSAPCGNRRPASAVKKTLFTAMEL